jgi:hypothetical protein
MPIRRAACSTDNVRASSLWCSFVMVAPYERKGAELHIYVVSPRAAPSRQGRKRENKATIVVAAW